MKFHIPVENIQSGQNRVLCKSHVTITCKHEVNITFHEDLRQL